MIPVDLRVLNLYTRDSDWLVKNRKIREGLFTARAIVTKDSGAIQVINLSEKEQRLNQWIESWKCFCDENCG